MNKLTNVLLFLFIGLSMSFPLISQNHKIDESILDHFAHNIEATGIFVSFGKINTNFAKTIKGKDQKAHAVYQYLKNESEKNQRSVSTYLKELQIDFQQFVICNAIFLKADLKLIQSLSNFPKVEKIVKNSTFLIEEIREETKLENRMPEAEWGIKMIQADRVWNLGYTGQGVVVAGQDTGFEWDVNVLKEKYRGYDTDTVNHNFNWHDAIHEINLLHGDSIIQASNNPCGLDVNYPCDDYSHGTHTMGTMIGSDEENLIGVAPGAKWIACRNMERGYGSPYTYLECFEWFLAPTDLAETNPDPSKSPHVINNSWSCPEMEGCDQSNFFLLEDAVNNLKNADIVVVVSAGNSGGQGCESINTPAAIFENSFTVGATRSNDTIANFSSRGLVTIDSSFLMKPNVAAPGVQIRSVVRGGGFASWSGTSMAGPHVAGAVALIISANPNLAGEVETIETILEQTAVQKTTSESCNGISGNEVPNPIYGYGRINVLAAVEMAKSLSSIADLESDLNLEVYPNPTSGIVYFKTGNINLISYQILDLNKRIIEDKITGQKSNQVLKMDHLDPGIYFLRIFTTSNVPKSIKIIKING